MWQPAMNWQAAKRRAEVISEIRMFFAQRGVIEVETPMLSKGTVTDVHLDAFSTLFNYCSNSDLSESDVLYLQTSPEFAMKRLLAAGYGCCYQIAKAFRHEQAGRYHNPEFTLLEWYRLGFSQHQLMDEVEALLIAVLNCNSGERISYQALFIRELGLDPLSCSVEQLRNVINTHNKMSDWLIVEKDKDTLLQFVMAELIEPKIGIVSPCFVYNFPVSQASLARINEQDNRVAERFECYFKGIELANGFNELTDARQQRMRFQADNEQRLKLGLSSKPIDENFLAALSSGLPQCSGVALGLDRLLMLALGTSHIEQTMTFSIENA